MSALPNASIASSLGTKSARRHLARRMLGQGQGMMEYIIIVALIAIAAIGVYSAFGKTVRNQQANISKELSGNKADMTASTGSANSAAGRANDPQKEGMGQYNYANDAK